MFPTPAGIVLVKLFIPIVGKVALQNSTVSNEVHKINALSPIVVRAELDGKEIEVIFVPENAVAPISSNEDGKVISHSKSKQS